MPTALIIAPRPTTLEAVAFDEADHRTGALEVLLRLRDADAAYPPIAADGSASSLESWLLDGTAGEHWVVLADGVVAGHVALAPPGRHLTESLADLGHVSGAANGVREIDRLFTDPIHQGLGIGSQLFAAAVTAAELAGHQPAVSVPGGSYSALSFCAAKGLQELGSVVSVEGRSIVFVRDPEATRIDRFAAMRRGLLNLLG